MKGTHTAPDRSSRAARILLALTLAGAAHGANAATFTKANNTTSLNLVGSWTDGTLVPGSTDIALWNNTVTGVNSVLLGADTAWGEIQLINPGGAVTIGTGNTLTLNGVNGIGIDMSAATQNLTITAPLVLAGNQQWNVANGRTLTINGTTGFNQGTSNLTLNGLGTVAFSPTFGTAANTTATGSITVNGGTLSINSGNTTGFPGLTNVLSGLTPLAVGGGTVSTAVGNSVGTYTQNFNGLTINQGASSFTQTRGSSSTVVDNFGTLARNVGGTANLAPTSNNSGFRTSTANTNGILSGGLTLNGTDFAQAASATTNIAAAAYTADTWGTTTNTNVTTSSAPVSGSTTNSLRFNTAGAFTVTLGGTNTITSGGILVGATTGANTSTITGGTLQGSAGGDLIVHQYDTSGSLTIASTIADNTSSTALTKAGAGALVLSGNNTYTGGVYLNAGTIKLANAGALNSSGSNAVTFTNNSSGKLQLNGNNAAVSGLTTSTVLAATAPIVENANATAATLTVNNGSANTYAGTLQDGTGGGSLGLTKTGTGTLTLGGTNTYTGATNVSNGTVALTGSAGLASTSIAVATGATLDVSGRTGASLTLSSGQNLSGSGTVNGGIVTTTGSSLSTGTSGVGTLSVGSLTLASGAIFNYDFNSTPANDLINVTGLNGLTVNGGGFNLFAEGTSNKWTTTGTYNLFQFNGTIGGTGVGAFTSASILNPQGGLTYSFGVSGNFLQLTIGGSLAVISAWNSTGSGSWGSSGNWSNGIPNTSGATAQFTSAITGPSTITLDGSQTVGAVEFNNASQAYTIAQGSGGNLVLDNGAGTSTVTDTNGSHVISAPLSFNSDVAMSVANSADNLTVSGLIADGTAAHSLTKLGSGTLILANTANTYSGGTNINGGTLEFAGLGSLGTGAISLAGSTLRWGAGNTDDISSRTVTIGSGGATFDTNGNTITLGSSFGNNGVGALTKSGAGTLTLLGANTYAGGTVIAAGTLAIGGDTALGAIPSSAATNLTFNAGTGNTSTLQTNSAFTLNANRTVSLSSGTGAIDTNGNNVTLGGALTGAGNFSKVGTGTLTLGSVASGATGAVTLNGGTLTAANISYLPTGGLTFNNSAALNLTQNAAQTIGNITANGTNSITTSANTNIISYGTFVGGTGNLTISTTYISDFVGSWTGFNGTITLAGANSFRFNGSTGASTATLDLGTRFINVRSTATVITLGGLAGSAGSTLSGSGGGALQAVNYTIGGANTSTTFGGAITDGTAATSLTKTGTGTLTLGGASTYTGATNVANGTLAISGSGTLGNGGSLTLGGGSLDLGTTSQTVGAVSVTSAAASGNTIGNGSLTGASYSVSNASGNALVTANLLANGSIGLSKTGAGTVTLSGANTYTGTTSVTGGILSLGTTGSLASTAYSIGNGATFDASGLSSYSLAGVATSIDVGATTAGFFNGPASGLLTLGNSLTLNLLTSTFTSGQTFNLLHFAGKSGDFSAVSLTGSLVGSLLLNSPDTWTGSIGGYDFTFDQTAGTLSILTSAIPEPSTYAALAGLMILAFAGYRRRRA